jgi:hypothetical protein
MLDALCTGTTDPEVLAELARGRMRKMIPALREALEEQLAPLAAQVELLCTIGGIQARRRAEHHRRDLRRHVGVPDRPWNRHLRPAEGVPRW